MKFSMDQGNINFADFVYVCSHIFFLFELCIAIECSEFNMLCTLHPFSLVLDCMNITCHDNTLLL